MGLGSMDGEVVGALSTHGHVLVRPYFFSASLIFHIIRPYPLPPAFSLLPCLFVLRMIRFLRLRLSLHHYNLLSLSDSVSTTHCQAHDKSPHPDHHRHVPLSFYCTWSRTLARTFSLTAKLSLSSLLSLPLSRRHRTAERGGGGGRHTYK